MKVALELQPCCGNRSGIGMYTYELANYPGGFYALQEGYMDAWQDGALFRSALHHRNRLAVA